MKHQNMQSKRVPVSVKTSQKLELLSFNFEVVGVNAKGEQIRKESKQSQYFSEDLSNDITLEMVAIPGGTFTMGSPQDEKDSFKDERPQHEVTVSTFFMGKYPITQAQWRAIASRTDLKVEKDLDPDPSHFKDRGRSSTCWDRPVEQVDWYDAVEFCTRLSKLTGGGNTDFPVRRNGSTPVVLEPPPHFTLGKPLPGNWLTMMPAKPTLMNPKENIDNKRLPWDNFPPMPSVCMICTATSGSGVLILGTITTVRRRMAVPG